ncbi:hypothetical protein [Candidatus Nitrosacidococcus tergens]|uniref:Lipoprotein SmpA/OmlA domain-containing protein n=1 Tax=Candidatus Nitrosacidococcus tergens TaxID=553981 RepID=A0A7G1Q7J6_9GAMM|nr:hypothetical protein [Candidatus Nitrosacidococcus tergens]CAB1274403.1 exported protein of unknown function [Candidatus Nitrosacidococcus tergens]
MKKFIFTFIIVSSVSLLAGCPQIDSYKYMAFGMEDELPPRTEEAARAQFKDSNLIYHETTESDVRKLLGTPDKIEEEEEHTVYQYTKDVPVEGHWSNDQGTTYVVKYEFDTEGKLVDKEYATRPMGISDPPHP